MTRFYRQALHTLSALPPAGRFFEKKDVFLKKRRVFDKNTARLL